MAPIPLERPFERVPLPPKATRILAVEGRNERDVWLLSRDALFHWDGARVVEEKGPPCNPWPDHWGLALTPGAVLARGVYDNLEGQNLPTAEARRQGPGRWSCSDSEAHLRSIDLGANRLLWDGYPDPPSVPLRLWMRGQLAAGAADDVWSYGDGEVLHSNGVEWVARPTGLKRVFNLRVDATGVAWLVGSRREEGDGEVVLRWDLSARAWRRVPVPSEFRATRVRVRSGRDAWLIGEAHVHHWDGHTLRRAQTPLAVESAWVGPSGELWLAGAELTSLPDKPAAGVAFRVSAPQENKP